MSSALASYFRTCLFVFLVAVLAVSPSYCQFYFGKNKVQYTRFEWQVMTTDHFRVYFYKSESEIAKIAARLAEDSYRALAAKFNHEVRDKIPLIIYSSPNYFSQTNVIPGLLPESVGGFTEFIKGRVVVPFHGSYYDFDHVIRHELVHVFTFSKLEDVLSRRRRARHGYPPLWFTEGLAEYWSKKWDTEADMILKDMIINEKLFTISTLHLIQGTYFMYKVGESICHFIDSAYGPDKLVRIFDNWYKGRSFEEVVKVTLGDNLTELSQKWEYSLKKKYYPQLEDHGLPDMESKRLTTEGFSVKGVPIHWDDGRGVTDWVVFKANRRGYSGIYMIPIDGEDRRVKTLLKGESSSAFESLYLLRSGIDANDSGLIVFSSKSKESDVIYLYELLKGRVTKRFEFENLVAARSPRLSPDGVQVVFSGVEKSGFSNLYLLDLSTGGLRALTNDIYYDIDPDFSPDGGQVVFASDRGVGGQEGALNLFTIDLSTGSVTQRTFGSFRDQSPDWTQHGIYFASNREGTYNLYLLDDDGNLTCQSTYVTGAFDPRLSSNGTKLVYSGYQDLQFQIYLMDVVEKPEIIEQSPVANRSTWEPRVIDSIYSRTSIKYDATYSLDIAQSSIGYDPVYGSLGGLQVAVSDVLGNRAFYLLLTNTADNNDELLESINFGLTYINRARRLNWGVGVYHLYDEYFNDFDGFFYEREAGVLSLFSYPVSKFHRLDLTTLARYSNRTKSFGAHVREAFLVTHYLSWVYDNSIWEITGPIEGRRYNFTVGITNRMDELGNFNRLAMADVRHYFRLGKYSSLANRLFAYMSSGREPQRIYFGGSWSFRGFSRRAFYNRNILFASNELRFPLIDNLLIGFPFGGLDFRGIRGAIFFDTGSAWDDEFDQFLGSFGAGFRVSLGYVIVLRFDFTRTTDFKSISPRTDFDFFFGWNF
ncbi:MAG: peptidase MA family metallohydrolase [Candidatus Zixiibacteriota bacterium]